MMVVATRDGGLSKIQRADDAGPPCTNFGPRHFLSIMWRTQSPSNRRPPGSDPSILAPTDATHGLVPGLLFRLATHGSLHRRSCCDTQTKQPRLESQTPGWCTVVRLSSNWQTRWESIRVCRLPRKSFANGVHPRPPSRDRRRLSSREADQLERRLQPRLDALGRLPAPNSCSPDAVRAWVSTPSAASGPARDSMQGDQRRIRERLRCRF